MEQHIKHIPHTFLNSFSPKINFFSLGYSLANAVKIIKTRGLIAF